MEASSYSRIDRPTSEQCVDSKRLCRTQSETDTLITPLPSALRDHVDEDVGGAGGSG